MAWFLMFLLGMDLKILGSWILGIALLSLNRKMLRLNFTETSIPDRTNSPNQLNLPQSDVIAVYRKGSCNFSRSASKRTRPMLRSSANQTATLSRARNRTLRLTLLILLTFIVLNSPYVFMTLWYSSEFLRIPSF